MKRFLLKTITAPIIVGSLNIGLVGCGNSDNNISKTSDFDYVPSIERHKQIKYDNYEQAANEFLSAITNNPQILVQDYLYDKASHCKRAYQNLIDQYGQDNVAYSFEAGIGNLEIHPYVPNDLHDGLVRMSGILSWKVDATYTTTISESQNKQKVNIVDEYYVELTNVVFRFTYCHSYAPENYYWEFHYNDEAEVDNWCMDYKISNVETTYITDKDGDTSIAVIGAGVEATATTIQELESSDQLKNLNFISYYFEDVDYQTTQAK